MSLSGRIRTSAATALVVGAGALFATGCGLLDAAAPAAAQSDLQSIFEVPNIASDPATTLQVLRYLGVDILRLPLPWNQLAANPTSRTPPTGDPYPAANFAAFDQVVRSAQRMGIAVDLMPTGPAPLWATQPGAPPTVTNSTGSIDYTGTFEPSASAYGQFVRAAAARYSSVHFWEIWNEANWGPSLTPQYLNGSKVPVSAKIYRGLLDAGWSALHSTGHGHDTILFGSLSQDGSAQVGETGTTAPLTFTRALYCLDSSYRQLKGTAASQAGCPTSKSGFKHFREANPALFGASGLGLHPYPFAGNPPTKLDFPNPNGAEFAEIPQVLRALDRMQHAYGSHKQLKVYNTEYAYRTHPNDPTPFASPTNAAAYINEAEYLSWKNARIATYDQYELVDAGWFPTGLFFPANAPPGNPRPIPYPKPSFYAYRLPVWLPVTSPKRGRTLEVWGDVRAARYARIDTGQPQSVQIQFSSSAGGPFRTIRTVRIKNPYGYFDVRVKFPSSGYVRLAWTYPSGDARLTDQFYGVPGEPADLTSPQVYSRVTNIKLR
jgi:hypothetical protein